MIQKLERAEDRFREIEQLITLPDIVSNNKEYSKLMKEYTSLTPIIEKYREYKSEEKEMKDSYDVAEAIKSKNVVYDCSGHIVIPYLY